MRLLWPMAKQREHLVCLLWHLMTGSVRTQRLVKTSNKLSLMLVLRASELLKRNPDPSRDEIRRAIAGNICRCTGYIKIFEAIELAAARLG